MSRFGNKLLAKVQAGKPVKRPPTPVQAIVSHNGGNVFNCFIPGDPQSQGGTVPLRNKKTGLVAQVTRGSKGLGKWRIAMTKAFAYARKETGHQTFTGPCKLQATFFMPRLAGHPKTIQGRFWADTSLDLDKMERAVNDSLTKAGVFENDSRVCISHTLKRYASLTDTPGVHIVVSLLPKNGGPEEILQDATARPEGVKTATT